MICEKYETMTLRRQRPHDSVFSAKRNLNDCTAFAIFLSPAARGDPRIAGHGIVESPIGHRRD